MVAGRGLIKQTAGDAQLRAVLDDVSDLVAVVADDGSLRYVNAATQRWLGYAEADLIGHHSAEFLVLERHANWSAVLAEALATPGLHGPFEVNVRAADGSVRVLRLAITNRTTAGDEWGIVVTARDETDHVALRRSLEDTHAWWNALLRLGTELILVVDDDGRVHYASPAVTTVLGYSEEEVLGINAFELVHPDDMAHVVGDFVERLEGHPPHDLTHFRARARDGSWRQLAAYGADVRDEPGEGSMIITARDVTAELAASEALRHSEERFRAMVQHSSDFIVLADPDGTIRYASPAVSRILGFSRVVDADPAEVFAAIHPDDVAAIRGLLERTAREIGASEPVHVRVGTVDGDWRVVELIGQNLLADPAVGALVFNGRDVTDRERFSALLREQATLLEAVAQGAPLEATLVQVAAVVEEQIPGAQVVIGLREHGDRFVLAYAPSMSAELNAVLDLHPADSALGHAVRQPEAAVFPDVLRDERWSELWEALEADGLRACWTWPILAPDELTQVGLFSVLMPTTGPPTSEQAEVGRRAVHLAAIAVERHRVEQLLQHRAAHDLLTGLPNRTLLVDRIAQALARGARSRPDVAVLFVDLDQFKVVNDSLGHACGDELLVQVAQRFQRALQPGDTVARFGGDEFVLVSDEVGGVGGAVALAERLLAALREPFTVTGQSIIVTASIGIAHSADASVGAGDLVRDADAAMYQAKANGRGGHCVFEPGMHEHVMERFHLESDLRRASIEGGFDLWYQPIVRLADLRIVGVEALVRWNRPGSGLVSPASFIPLAEETGLIVPIGRRLLADAVEQVASWHAEADLAHLALSVNVSALQLANPGFMDHLADTVGRSGLDPTALTVEVTESILVDGAGAAGRAFAALHELGVRMSIDDFGTGYASLEHLRSFTAADELKIDRIFVADLEGDTAAHEAIVSASIVLARALGLRVVAEGVESVHQLHALRRLGCAYAQGFLFSRPVPAAELPDLVRRGVDPIEGSVHA